MEISTLFAPLATGALDSVEAIVPLAIPVVVVLISITLAIRTFGKFGLKR